MHLFDALIHPERIPHHPATDGTLLNVTMSALGWSFDGRRWRARNGLVLVDRHPCGHTDLLGFLSPDAQWPALVVPLPAGTPDIVSFAVLCALARDLHEYLDLCRTTGLNGGSRPRVRHTGRPTQHQGW